MGMKIVHVKCLGEYRCKLNDLGLEQVCVSDGGMCLNVQFI